MQQIPIVFELYQIFFQYLVDSKNITEEDYYLLLKEDFQERTVTDFLQQKENFTPSELALYLNNFKALYQQQTVQNATTFEVNNNSSLATNTKQNSKEKEDQTKASPDSMETPTINLIEGRTKQEASSEKFLSTKRYQVLKTLGEGGMGVVQLVRDLLLGREVARKSIKRTSRQWSDISFKDRLRLERLQTEAILTSVLEHPNIVPLYDMQEDEQGNIQFTMRKIEGETLSSLLNNTAPEEKIEAENKWLSIFLKICDAVAYAHNQGVIHRDLKPDNIMVGQFGEVYVMDWGIAKKIDTAVEANISWFNEKKEPSSKTIGGIGTPGYMAPEQKSNASFVTPESDIYALGKILKQCFTYLSPMAEFKYLLDKYKDASLKNIQKEKGEVENELEFLIPKDIKAIIEKATQEEKAKRYGNVSELKNDIESYLNHKRVSARDYSLTEIFAKWLKRNKNTVRFSFTILLLCIVFPLYFNWQQEQDKRRERRLKFKKAFQSGEELRQKAEELGVLRSPQKQLKKMDFLLKSFNALTSALLIKPDYRIAEEKKINVGISLVELCCETKDYQLANYIVNNLKSLSRMDIRQEKELVAQIDLSKTQRLREHQNSLRNWLKILQSENVTREDKEQALLEISKMPEPEILQELSFVLEEASQFFLSENVKNVKKTEYYILITKAFGWIGNIEATPYLLKASRKIASKLQKQKISEIQYEEMNFLVALINALKNVKAQNISQEIDQIRFHLAKLQIFKDRTENAYMLLMQLDFAEKKELANAGEYLRRAELNIFLKNYSKALKDIEYSLVLLPNNYNAYNMMGGVYLQQGKFQESLQCINKAIQLAPQEVSLYENRGHAFLNLKEYQEALANFNKAIEINSASAKAYEGRARTKKFQGDLIGAIEDYIVAEKLNPYLDVSFNRGLAYYQNGDLEKAIKDFTHTILLNPDSNSAYGNRGNIWKELKQYDKAIEDYTKVIELMPQSYSGYINRANTKQEKGDSIGAIADYKEALRLKPDGFEALIGLGNLNKENNNFATAISFFTQVIETKPEYWEMYWHRGSSYYFMNKFEEAILDLTKVKELKPDSFEAVELLGKIYHEQNNYPLAIENYSKTIELKPKKIFAYQNRATIWERIGNLDKAFEDTSKVIELDPSIAEMYLIRGNVRVRRGDFEEALVDFSLGIKLNPENIINFYKNRGITKRNLKDYQGAIGDYNQILERDPKNDNAYLIRGHAKRDQGRMDEAIQDYLISYQLSPNPAVLNLICDDLLNQMIQKYRNKNFLGAKKDLLLFQKHAPKKHPKYSALPKMLKAIEQQIEKTNKKK